jgi:AraC-like DNA-binding protein
MPGSGIRTFTDTEDYRAALRQWQIDPLMICCGAFRARLTWVELGRLYLLQCQEDHPRIAYVSLQRGLTFAAFRTDSGTPPLWAGTGLQLGDLVFHSPGEQFHQRTTGSCMWNLIALTAEDLGEFGRTLFGLKLAAPPTGRMILRPAPQELACLRRLHTAACRLAETKPRTLAHSEAARSLEQDLILALVTCLMTNAGRADTDAKGNHAGIMIRLEEVLAEHLRQPLPLPDLCELIGTTVRTLQSCCTEFLGISPSRYVLLRRLKEVQIALRDADPTTASAAEIVGSWGFFEVGGRFGAAYFAAFGETPLTTLHREPRSRIFSAI